MPSLRHALRVRRHVRLADKGGAHAKRPQEIANGVLRDAQGDIVPVRAVGGHVAAGIGAHAAGAANGRLAVGMPEQHALCGQRVQGRGLQRRMAAGT